MTNIYESICGGCVWFYISNSSVVERRDLLCITQKNYSDEIGQICGSVRAKHDAASETESGRDRANINKGYRKKRKQDI